MSDTASYAKSAIDMIAPIAALPCEAVTGGGHSCALPRMCPPCRAYQATLWLEATIRDEKPKT